MATISAVITQYEKLCRFCDAIWALTAGRYANEINCRKGCADCCRLETVNILEAHIISTYLANNDLQGSLEVADSDLCHFLADNLCSIYPARPLTCRTHGMPLKSQSLTGGAVDCCPLNFPNTGLFELESKYVLDIDMITDNLMRLNMAFCLLSGEAGRSGERIMLRDIPRIPAR